jgi:hypothetical protein
MDWSVICIISIKMAKLSYLSREGELQVSNPERIPDGYNRIKLAKSWDDLSAQSYEGGENGILYPRTLSEDFTALARDLYEARHDKPSIQKTGASTISIGQMKENPQLQQYSAAIEVIHHDMQAMWKRPNIMSSSLLLIGPESYTDHRIEEFHADGRDEDAAWERVMCCYAGATTEIVRNEDARLRPDCDASLYDITPDAKIFHFGLGDVWRQLSNSRGQNNPLIHRAPMLQGRGEPRLYIKGDFRL